VANFSKSPSKSQSKSQSKTVWLSADEAAERLQISKATLYAYVSRGRISRTVDADGRRSRFNAGEVAEIVGASAKPPRAGAIGVRIDSAVSEVTESGLRYRGRDIRSLIGSVSFESVADLLWESSGPSWRVDRKMQLRGAQTWRGSGVVTNPAAELAAVLLAIHADVGDVAVGGSARGDVTGGDTTGGDVGGGDVGDGVVRDGDAGGGYAIAADVATGRSARGELAVSEYSRKLICALTASLPGVRRTERTVAERLWRHCARRTAKRGEIALIDAALVSLADHEMATSTFAVRLAASTRADIAMALVAGLGTLSGPLHGSASAAVISLMQEAHATGRADSAITAQLRSRRFLPGFGHKVYESEDPRCVSLLDSLRKADVDRGRLATVEHVFSVATARVPKVPNVDFALGAIMFCCGLPPQSGELIFGIARMAGWTAHYIEELTEAPLRYRVRSNYRGR
jgi:citrate synthase